jgi:hypothetical protein
MHIKLSLCLALAGTLAFSAQAATTTWGVHGPLEVAATITPTGPFSDTYLFDLASANSVFSTAVSNNLTSVLGLTGGTVSLFREAGVVDTPIGSFAFNDTTGGISHAFGALQGGSYYYLVNGTGSGTMGGFYSLTSTLAAVPEPKIAVVLLAGLAAIGFVTARRSKS